jgi:hypothetical protein
MNDTSSSFFSKAVMKLMVQRDEREDGEHHACDRGGTKTFARMVMSIFWGENRKWLARWFGADDCDDVMMLMLTVGW